MTINELVEENMNLVYKIAQKFNEMARNNYHYDLEDLIQEGMVGLVQAAQKFDDSLGYKFSTFATPIITHRIQDFLCYHGTNVYFGKNASYYAYLINKGKLINEPISVIAEKTGLTEAKVKVGLAYANNKPCYYLDALIDKNDSESEEFYNIIFADEVDFNKNLIISEFYSKLRNVEKKVLYYMLRDVKQREIAKILGVTHQMVNQHVKQIRQRYTLYEAGVYLSAKDSKAS